MELAKKLVESANKTAVTDAAVATIMARSAVLSALYNVKINLVSITDKGFVLDVTKQVEHMEKETEKREKEILSAILFWPRKETA
jgi:formiminotetrahydrofolate cyclodeaminase